MGDARYQSDSESKWLIYKNFVLCFFSGQFKKSLDFQGFAHGQNTISTKLSTETLNALQNHYRSST
jgi:hypothetical protein